MNSCYLCHLHKCVISLLSQTHSASFCICFICFGGPISWILKTWSTRRHDSWSFLVFYEYFPMVWTSSVEDALRPTNDSRVSPLCWEKVGDDAAVAPSSFLITAISGTNKFVLKNIFLFFRSFSFVISTELIVEILQYFLSFQIGKVLITLTY